MKKVAIKIGMLFVKKGTNESFLLVGREGDELTWLQQNTLIKQRLNENQIKENCFNLNEYMWELIEEN
jgi:hypothetical protein